MGAQGRGGFAKQLLQGMSLTLFALVISSLLCLTLVEAGQGTRHKAAHARDNTGHLWNLLMENPSGKNCPQQPQCAELYYTYCDSDGDYAPPCCSGECVSGLSNAAIKRCCPEGKQLNGADCDVDEDCCGPDAYCYDADASNKVCAGTVGCFSGATKVQTLEFGTTPLQEVKTGQHIQCADTADNSLVPAKTEWCEVFNWVESNSFNFHQQKISFQRPDGTSGSLTVSSNHLMLAKAPRPARARGKVAAISGSTYRTMLAEAVRVGDKLAVANSPGTAAATDQMATVTAVKIVKDRGAFIPAIAKPFIVVEGVVVPLLTGEHVPVETHGKIDTETAQLKVVHAGITPLLGQYLQPKGTRGVDAVWGVERRWPGTQPLKKLVREKVRANKVVDYAVVERYMALKRTASKIGLAVVKAEDALAFFETVWVDGPPPVPQEFAG